MKIAIVEDEAKEQEIIVKYIGEWAEARRELVEFRCFPSSESFLFAWEDGKDYRLLVLDIEMGGMNGLGLAEKVRLEDREVPILFVTGYDEYMQRGYDVSALHYLMKPVDKERLFQALDRMAEAKREEGESLVLNGADEVRRVQTGSILYVEAAGHGSVMHKCTWDGAFPLRESLGEIEKRVNGIPEIVKCHRAYLVNLRFVSAIRNAELILDNGERLAVSRTRVKQVQREFLRYYKSR